MSDYRTEPIRKPCPSCGERQSYDETTHKAVGLKNDFHTHCRQCDVRLIWSKSLGAPDNKFKWRLA